jgi:hypothetical protein
MTEDEAVAFIPDLGDNRDLPEEEQIWAEILPMTGQELRTYQRVMMNTKANSKLAFEKAEKVVRRIMKERVVAVHNYADIKDVPIEDGEQVYDRGEPEMVDALYTGLTQISTLKAGLRKK